jgi:Icc-related predicted phosphoesterase
MKFICISDTHGQHHQLNIPQGDVLIHAGDVSSRGKEKEIVDFLSWFEHQKFEHKIFIAGNHDFYFEKNSNETIQQILPKGVTYLNDTSTIINGIKIWGSPITPFFYNWAFNRHRGEEIKKHWDLIPNDIDILITHGPVFKTLDKNVEGDYVGCKDLLGKVQEVKPKVHVCGHIHEAYGMIEKSAVKFINASLLNELYEVTNLPIEFDITDKNSF